MAWLLGLGSRPAKRLSRVMGVISSVALPSASGRLSFKTTLSLPSSAIDNRSCDTGGRRQYRSSASSPSRSFSCRCLPACSEKPSHRADSLPSRSSGGSAIAEKRELLQFVGSQSIERIEPQILPQLLLQHRQRPP